MNQNFVTRTFLEKNRVLERFKIENDLRLFIDKNLSTETFFWDIGACVGNFSIYAGTKLGTVYAFEPDGLTYSSLITNIYESNLLNITVIINVKIIKNGEINRNAIENFLPLIKDNVTQTIARESI
jgi:hypothetical protein